MFGFESDNVYKNASKWSPHVYTVLYKHWRKGNAVNYALKWENVMVYFVQFNHVLSDTVV